MGQKTDTIGGVFNRARSKFYELFIVEVKAAGALPHHKKVIKDGEKLRAGMRHMLHGILSELTDIDDLTHNNIFVVGIQVISTFVSVWVTHRIGGLYCTNEVYNFTLPADIKESEKLRESLLGLARLREPLEKAINALESIWLESDNV